MSVRLTPLPAADADIWLQPAVHTYVTAMNYPRGTEYNRLALWREHLRRPGWTAIGAVTTVSAAELLRPAVRRLRVQAPWAPGERDVLVGVAYGYTGAADQWWNQQLRTGMRLAGWTPEEAQAVISDYFELTELHVHPLAQGQGTGEALLRRLLTDRPESQVLLSTPEVTGEANRAWTLYRRLGFGDVLRHFSFPGDPRPFAFLGRSLPLPPGSGTM